MALPPPLTDAPLCLPPLPPEILVEILSRVRDTVAVVRCAATCKAWRGLIQEPSFLSHLHRGGTGLFDPSPFLGFFFRDTSQKLPRRRLYRRRPTCFLLLGSSPSQPLALHLSHFLPSAAGLGGFAPVASGASGHLALLRASASSCDPARICVCNPVAGTSTFLPPLLHLAFPDPENIVFLEAGSSSFRLLAVMEHYLGLLLRVFSSQTGEWGTSVTAQLPDNMVVLLSSPAVVHHGTVHWICGTRALPNAVHALAVHLGEADALVSRIDLPLRAGLHRLSLAARAVRLASSAQGSLSLVLLDEPVVSIWNFEDGSCDGKSWSLHKTIYLMSILPPAMSDASVKWGLSVKAFCGKSSSLFLHAVGEGLFVLNLETEAITKVCKDHCIKYMCPYVADLSSCLVAMKKF